MLFELFSSIVLVIILLISTCYVYFKYKFTYWSKENIPYLEPSFPFGNFKPIYLGNSFADTFRIIYCKLKKKTKSIGGFYTVSRPSLLILDLDLLKNIMVKDFKYFVNRTGDVDKKLDPLSANLLFLKDNEWKNSRTQITPIFSSGKIKNIFPLIIETCKILQNVIDEHIEYDKSLNTGDIFTRLAIDIIGTVAFGIDCNTLKNLNVEFKTKGYKIFQFNYREALIYAFFINFPSLLKLFNVTQIPKDVSKFYMNVIEQNIEYREKNNIERNDFFDLMIRLKNKNYIFDTEEEKKNYEYDTFTFNKISAHCFSFFSGYESASNSLNFGLYEIANNFKIQNKLRKEIFETIKEDNGELTYDGVMGMEYLNKVVCEILRKYPVTSVLGRECNEDYKVPNSNFTIKKGTDVVVTVLGIHRDPEYYPDPEKFDPERFSEEAKATRHPYSYMPFGTGPRICVAMRFALFEIKCVIAFLLMNYSFTVDPKTITPITFHPNMIFLASKNTIWLKAKKIVI